MNDIGHRWHVGDRVVISARSVVDGASGTIVRIQNAGLLIVELDAGMGWPVAPEYLRPEAGCGGDDER